MHIAQGGFVITYQKRHKNMLVADHEKKTTYRKHIILYYITQESLGSIMVKSSFKLKVKYFVIVFDTIINTLSNDHLDQIETTDVR